MSDVVEDDLNEVSSLAFSSQTDSQGNRYAYMVSDKIQKSLKVIRLKDNVFGSKDFENGVGTPVANYTLFTQIPGNGDWEDISLGPCSNSGNSTCIYIADTGNNNDPKRKELYIYKFEEPAIGSNGPVDLVVDFVTIGFQYGEGFDQSLDTYYDGKPAMLKDLEAMLRIPS